MGRRQFILGQCLKPAPRGLAALKSKLQKFHLRRLRGLDLDKIRQQFLSAIMSAPSRALARSIKETQDPDNILGAAISEAVCPDACASHASY